MNALDAWRNRPMKCTSSTLCDDCNIMRPDPSVMKREFTAPNWSVPHYSVTRTCCSSCFEVAKTRARAEAQAELVGVVCC